MIKAFILFLSLIALSGQILAQDDGDGSGLFYANEQLSDSAMEDAAFDLMLELRCIQCQGQSIADSDAPIAEAMRHEVRLQIKNGKSTQDVKNWLIVRYGDFVSFDPPLSGVSLLLWGAPLIVFLLAIFLVLPLFRKRKDNDERFEG